MAIIVRHNDELALKIVEFRGKVWPAELTELNLYHMQKRDIAASDALHLVETCADFSAVSRAFIDRTRKHYARLFSQTGLTVCRRSAWLCRSANAKQVIDYWLRDRHKDDGFFTNVRLVKTLDEASDWLMLSPEEAARLASGNGFVDLARFERGLIQAAC